ncbi:alcohol oxidase-like protein [Irpex rosettiformis]|uniref:Alcohol oxidase-like protein n=1 Tax=Irpex rosettiformis TaxID=378272 RepID=A0ACB8UAW2_9APHY|nr:alcohol oxidase-like protein [Irpex rosettiformis]
MSAGAEYDIIIAGGGTTACVIAGRLSDADPNLKILIVEAGPHIQDDLAHIQPGRCLTHLVPSSITATFMVANPEEELAGRQMIVPHGHCVGGGSAINSMVYTRASPSDYDEWEKEFKNPGWGAKDIIPLLKKTETYQIAPGKESHGYSGPLKVSYGGAFTSVGREYLEVAKKYDPSRGFTEDLGGLGEVNSFGRWQKWISEDGKRSDAAHHYLYNKKRENVTIITGHIVKHVNFENKQAVGVEYIPNPRIKTNTSSSTLGVKVARGKQVVISSNSFGSPAILERSGIGAKKVLEKNGIEQIVDLPGVGENYQDHQALFIVYHASEEAETIDYIVRNKQPEFTTYDEEWKKTGKGLMASNGADAGIKLRFTPKELRAIGPNFTKKWEAYYASRKDSPAIFMALASMFAGNVENTPLRKYFSTCYFLSHPSSRGFVHICSADATDAPEFETGYLKQKDDLELLKYMYKRSREFARRMPCYRGEYPPGHPEFSKSSLVFPKADNQPVPIDAPDLVYSEEDEQAVDTFTRKAVATLGHSLGTCAMKPRETGGVVDSKLNVYGVQGLKVADLSIPPSNVAANTYSTALAIGEKAALIIAQELGISGV